MEEKISDKNESIFRLNSRLQNLEKLGQVLEQKGDELHQLDSQFHFEREQRLVLEKELKMLERDNSSLSQKLEIMEFDKHKLSELVSELKRSEVSYQMQIERLDSSLKYASLEQEKHSREN